MYTSTMNENHAKSLYHHRISGPSPRERFWRLWIPLRPKKRPQQLLLLLGMCTPPSSIFLWIPEEIEKSLQSTHRQPWAPTEKPVGNFWTMKATDLAMVPFDSASKNTIKWNIWIVSEEIVENPNFFRILTFFLEGFERFAWLENRGRNKVSFFW